jgi:hypothetical protein
MADSPAGRFYVEITTDRMEQLRRFTRAAYAAGNAPAFGRWLKEIEYRLAHEADEWGESRATYPGGRVEDRVGVVGELTVWYSVDSPRAIVYVKEFRLRGDPGAGRAGEA